MSCRKRKPSEQELTELVRHLCEAEPYGTEVWMRLYPEYFEPFFQAEDVCLWESPAVSAAAAPFWLRHTVDDLSAEAGKVVTHFLLHIWSFGQVLSLERLSAIIAEAQSVIDIGTASFVVGYRAMENLKEGEVSLLVLASVGPEPRSGS